MIHPDNRFFTESRMHWDDAKDWRSYCDQIDEVRYRQHGLTIPASMENRTRHVYSGTAGEKESMAVDLLTDKDGPVITAGRMGNSGADERRAELVQEWCTGALRHAHRYGERRLFRVVAQDILRRSITGIRVMHDHRLWSSIGRETGRKPSAAKRATRERYKRDNFPLVIEWRAGRGLYPRWIRGRGLGEVWDWELMTVWDVLHSWTDGVDADGEPIPVAKGLAAAFAGRAISAQDVVTVCTRADREHVQIAIVGEIVQTNPESRTVTQQYGHNEMLECHEHGMGVVPYAIGIGRETTADAAHLRYEGLLTPIESLVRAYDDSLTQQASGGFYAAYPTPFIETDKDAPGVGGNQQPPDMVLIEGQPYYLPPGSRLARGGLIEVDAYRLLEAGTARLEHLIELQTFGPVMYGASGSGTSGYGIAQLQGAADTRLESFESGLCDLYAATCGLLLRAGKAIIDAGYGPIPVRHSSDEGTKYVTLTSEHVGDRGAPCQEWDINVSVVTRPVGGMAAMAQTLTQLKAQGWIDDTSAMQKLGDRNPQRTLTRVIEGQVQRSQEIVQTITQVVQQRVLARLAQEAEGQIPDDAMIPQALAQLAAEQGSPAVTARLPGGGAGVPPGLPNPAPPAPTPSEPAIAGASPTPQATVPAVPGGPPAGVAQRLPGGTVRAGVNTPMGGLP